MIDQAELQERRELVARYFAEEGDPRLRQLSQRYLALGMALVLLWVVFFGVVATLFFLLPGVFALHRSRKLRKAYEESVRNVERPDAEAMDELLAKDLRNVKAWALSELGLQRDQLERFALPDDPVAELAGVQSDEDAGRRKKEPLMLFGPDPSSQAVIGQDGAWRFERNEVLVICPTAHQLGIYRCTTHLGNGTVSDEETHEYHYQDVVAVRTRVHAAEDLRLQPVTLRRNDDIVFERTLVREFQLVVSSGDRSDIVLGLSDTEDPRQEADLAIPSMDEVIGTVRTLLRAKKGASL